MTWLRRSVKAVSIAFDGSTRSMSSREFLGGLAGELARDGWSEIAYGFNLEGVYTFDLHAVKTSLWGIGMVEIFVTRCQAYLDGAKLQEYLGLYEIVKRKAHFSWTKSRIFFLCLLSEEGVSNEAASLVDRYAPEPLAGSGLFLCLVDLRSMVAHLKVPTLPLTYSRASSGVLERIGNVLSLRRTVPPSVQQLPRTYPCPTCGNPLSFLDQYQRWYCYRCQRYT